MQNADSGKIAFVIGEDDLRNQGDLAIVKAQVDLLTHDLGFSDVVVSVTHHVAARSQEPLLNIQPTLVTRVIAPEGSRAMMSPLRAAALSLGLLIGLAFMPLQLGLARLGCPLPYRRSSYRAVVEADVLVYAGGTSLRDVGSSTDSVRLQKLLSRWLQLFSLYCQFFWIKRVTGAKVIAFPNSIGPFHSRLGRLLVRRFIRLFDLFMLRETISATIARELGVEACCVIALDMAFHAPRAPIRFDREGREPVLGIAPRTDASLDREVCAKVHAAVADCWINATGGYVLYVPSNELGDGSPQDDLAVVERCLDLMKRRDRAEYISISKCEHYKAIVGSLDLLLATRMHPTLLAIPMGVPYVAIVCEFKQRGVAMQIGTEEFLFEIGDVNESAVERIVQLVQAAYRQRDALRGKLLAWAECLPAERTRVAQLIRSIMEGTPLTEPKVPIFLAPALIDPTDGPGQVLRG